ncbi:MAG: DUF6046 domain-containing protein [Prevotellaceae bacterium]|nr:DUF6046 domain-containing protein [Prevotellaceae bacterium]
MLPISFSFILAGAAVQAKGRLYGLKPARTGEAPSWEANGSSSLKPARTGEAPSWDGHGNPITTGDLTSPITDRSYWQDRYALCELTFENEKGSQLVMNDAIVSISRSKNIVSTQMVGREGTVKEYINDGDYEISIVVGIAAVRDGVIVDEYPSDGIRQLREYLKRQTALGVHSEFLDLFDINSIVIKSFSVSQDTASNYQVINISALSDDEYNIYSTDY